MEVKILGYRFKLELLALIVVFILFLAGYKFYNFNTFEGLTIQKSIEQAKNKVTLAEKSLKKAQQNLEKELTRKPVTSRPKSTRSPGPEPRHGPTPGPKSASKNQPTTFHPTPGFTTPGFTTTPFISS